MTPGRSGSAGRLSGIAWPATLPGAGASIAAIPKAALALWLAAVAVLVVRWPERIFRAEFLAEDGRAFFIPALLGDWTSTLLATYAGYLGLAQRAVAEIETLVPIDYAPLVGNALSILAAAAVAVLIASERLAWLAPRTARYLLALAFLVLPGTFTIYGTMSNIQWIAAAYLLVMVAAGPARSRLEASVDRVGLVAAGLSGIVVVFLWPLYAARAWADRSRHAIVALACVSIASAAQAIVILTGEGGRAIRAVDPVGIAEVMAFRGLWTPFLGLQGGWIVGRLALPTIVGLLATLVLVALIAMTVRDVPRRLWAPCAYAWVVIPAVAIAASGYTVEQLLDPLGSIRYFYVSSLILAAVVIVAHGIRRSVASTILVVLLGVAAVFDFTMPSLPSVGWAETNDCIGGAAPCVVPVQPGDAWAIRWPGQ